MELPRCDGSALSSPPLSRRHLLKSGACATAITAAGTFAEGASVAEAAPVAASGAADVREGGMRVRMQVNGRPAELTVDPRTTLLDGLREHLHLTGTKKGCDHGQCGACTVLVNGERINSCLSLAVMHEGDQVTTIEGLARGDQLHPMQAAFVEHDGFQCGYCTSGQICSAVGMLDEARRGMPSHVTARLDGPAPALSDAEIRERMSGNLCRCSAYPNIVAAIRVVARGGSGGAA
ncbi:MAG: 2Fe-2S iron-sulfur cluster-binding protein [Xylophilus ampelinus]